MTLLRPTHVLALCSIVVHCCTCPDGPVTRPARGARGRLAEGMWVGGEGVIPVRRVWPSEVRLTFFFFGGGESLTVFVLTSCDSHLVILHAFPDLHLSLLTNKPC
jgi:hypothetical protein